MFMANSFWFTQLFLFWQAPQYLGTSAGGGYAVLTKRLKRDYYKSLAQVRAWDPPRADSRYVEQLGDVIDHLWRLALPSIAAVEPMTRLIIPNQLLITQLAPHRAGLNGGLVHTYRLSHGAQRHPVPERPLPV